MTDENIKVYLGSTHSELKYNTYRDIENHRYTYHVEDNEWEYFVKEICKNKDGMIWTLNMVFLQICIMKNATFVLVTPTENYYDYYERSIIKINDKVCSYSK